MHKHILVLFVFLTLFSCAFAQTYTLSGKVTDGDLSEPLIGVTVMTGETGITTDFNGEYRLELPNGTHEIIYSYVGFAEKKETIVINGAAVSKDIRMGESSEMLTEVIVTADIAIERETPVAFSNISTLKIEEELASQDIPMLLNSTPGAYATQSGGGDGDARVSIRGFSQRNIAVMLDGIPVNDMENGRVYWSNWFGLDLVTKTMQVQRGLGASKLAIPSVGGTINILTKGIDSKRSLRFRQEVGNDGFLRSTLGLTSGRLENGWGISVAGSYKQGNGWVDGTDTKGYFYYLRVDKEIGNHLISFSGFGAPQEHGQRSFRSRIQDFDIEYAKKAGVSDSIAETGGNFGLQWNQHYGELERRSFTTDYDTIPGDTEQLNVRRNFYHKPQFSLRHTWSPNQSTALSNVVYVSIGNGGGTSTEGVPGRYDADGLQEIYDANGTVTFATGGDKISDGILQASYNTHFWVGALSTFRKSLSEQFTFSGGIDLRYYNGGHYREVYDLLGGDYYKSGYNARTNTTRLVVGDRFDRDYESYVPWAGTFGLLEYKNNGLSAFFNASFAETGYKYEDYLTPKFVSLDGEDTFLSYNAPLEYNGTLYTVDHPNPADVADAITRNVAVDSTSAQNITIGWVWKPGFTFKTGLGYNINASHNVFFNTGYLSRAPSFNATINAQGNSLVNNVENEKIIAFEAGYNYKSKKFAANLNTYFTNWANKPLSRLPTVPLDPSDPDSERVTVFVSGISARHLGVELDFAYELTQKITAEGLVSLGDWIWNSAAETTLPDNTVYSFDAKGVHVGDAAQTQLGGLIRYEPIKGLYFKLQGTYFGKNFANFNPEDLKGDNAGRESWQMPNYFLTNLHTGYRFKVKDLRMGVRFNVLNLFDTKYIGDATNNDGFLSPGYNDFDAKSASVFFGQGRRFNTSFQITF